VVAGWTTRHQCKFDAVVDSLALAVSMIAGRFYIPQFRGQAFSRWNSRTAGDRRGSLIHRALIAALGDDLDHGVEHPDPAADLSQPFVAGGGPAPPSENLTIRYTIMSTEVLQHQLRRLGWLTLDDGQKLEDGCWCLLAMRDRQTVLAFADSRREVWSAACSMVMRLTGEAPGGR
jgi:hypothetical protein